MLQPSILALRNAVVERFKSVILVGGVAARTMSAYIELNPVRAGMASMLRCRLRDFTGITRARLTRFGRLAPAYFNG